MNQQGFKSQLMYHKSKAEHGTIPPRWIKRIHLGACNLSAGRPALWFIIARCFTPPPPPILCFKFCRKLIRPRDWMGSNGMVPSTPASQCFAFMQSHLTYTHTQTHRAVRYYPPLWVLWSVLACVQSIFSNAHAHATVCVPNEMCQDGIMLRIQSDGP